MIRDDQTDLSTASTVYIPLGRGHQGMMSTDVGSPGFSVGPKIWYLHPSQYPYQPKNHGATSRTSISYATRLSRCVTIPVYSTYGCTTAALRIAIPNNEILYEAILAECYRILPTATTNGKAVWSGLCIVDIYASYQ